MCRRRTRASSASSMPVPESQPSFDPNAAGEESRFTGIHRSAGFRYAAVAICGVGLATAASTFLRLSGGWKTPEPTIQGTGQPVMAAAPAPSASRVSEPQPAAPPQAAPTTAAAAHAAEQLASREAPQQPPRRLVPADAPAATSAVPAAPAISSAIGPTPPAPTTSDEKPASPAGRAARAPEPDPRPSVPVLPPAALEPVRPAPVPTRPVASGTPDRLPEPPTAPAARQGRARPAEPAIQAPRRDSKPSTPRRSRYAAPSERAAPAQFRAAAAPAGTAPNVRSYSFAADGGRVVDASGTRVHVIRVK